MLRTFLCCTLLRSVNKNLLLFCINFSLFIFACKSRLLSEGSLLINKQRLRSTVSLLCSMKLRPKIKDRKDMWIDLLMFLVLASAIALLAVIL